MVWAIFVTALLLLMTVLFYKVDARLSRLEAAHQESVAPSSFRY